MSKKKKNKKNKETRKQKTKSRSGRVDVGTGYYCSASGIYITMAIEEGGKRGSNPYR
jgi:hypothetical protein